MFLAARVGCTGRAGRWEGVEKERVKTRPIKSGQWELAGAASLIYHALALWEPDSHLKKRRRKRSRKKKSAGPPVELFRVLGAAA